MDFLTLKRYNSSQNLPILTGKNCVFFNSVKNGSLAASQLFICLHNQVSPLYIPLSRVFTVQMFEKCDSSDRQVAPSSKFYSKIWVSFCLNTGKRLFRGFILKSTERA